MSEPRTQQTCEPAIGKASDGRLPVSVLIRIERRKRLTVPTGEELPGRPWDTVPMPLQLAIAQGLSLVGHAHLRSGQVTPRNLSPGGDRQQLPLSDGQPTTLAPDIVAAILDDALPNHITLFDLTIDPARLWEEQRARLGG